MCASVNEPVSGEPRCPLVPKLTRCVASATSGVRAEYSRSSFATSTSMSGVAGLPARGEMPMCVRSPLDVVRVVPQADHRLGALPVVSQRAQARRVQEKIPAMDRRVEAEPNGGEHANEVPAREQEYVAVDRTDPCHH